MKNMINAGGTLAREAAIDRRIDELIARLLSPGWTEAEASEYHQLVGARTSSMLNRSKHGRRRGLSTAAA